MKEPPKPPDEPQRQAAVTGLGLPDGIPEESINRVTRILAQAMDVPITAFSVIDHDSQVFTGAQGTDIREAPREHSFCGHAILRDDILVVENAREHTDFYDNPLVLDEPCVGFYAGIPIRSSDDRKLGSLCSIDHHSHSLTDAMVQCLYDGRDLLENELQLRSLNIRDSLTQAFNRGHFDDILVREWRRTQRCDSPLGLILADIDHFKEYNDTCGHPQGDACLQSVVRTLQTEAERSGDMVFRLGGEELAVLIPETSESGSAELAERIRRVIEAEASPHPGLTPPGVVTLSLGAVTGRPAESRPASPEALLEQADKLLYQAKAAGRNRAVAGEGSG